MYTTIATARASTSRPTGCRWTADLSPRPRTGSRTPRTRPLKAALHDYPQYKVRDQTDYKQDLKDQIGQLLNMIYGLLALAIIVAVLGVVNTLALSVVERTREIGLMRAIGLSRRQLRRMIRLESVVIALFGALLGLGLGMGWGATAQQLLALEGLEVLEIPWPTIIGGLRRLGVRGPVRRPGPGVPGGPDERPERDRDGVAGAVIGEARPPRVTGASAPGTSGAPPAPACCAAEPSGLRFRRPPAAAARGPRELSTALRPPAAAQRRRLETPGPFDVSGPFALPTPRPSHPPDGKPLHEPARSARRRRTRTPPSPKRCSAAADGNRMHVDLVGPPGGPPLRGRRAGPRDRPARCWR